MTRVPVVLLMAASLAACERVVGIDVDDGPERLVVEARLEAIPAAPSGRQSIRLTTTAPYFSNQPTPAARGAIVSVIDDRGAAVSFAESTTSPGVYETQRLVAAVGRTYTLRIDWKGDRYEATEQLRAVPPIDSLYFISRPGKEAASDGLRATIDLLDPAADANYYMWDQYVGGRRVVDTEIPYILRVVSSDELYAGSQVLNFQPFDEVQVQRGQVVKVRQYSISESVWRYYVAINQQAGGDGSPFDFPPANIRGNVANLTRPEVRALGAFMASAVAERQAIVP